jgi:hypothetical protein
MLLLTKTFTSPYGEDSKWFLATNERMGTDTDDRPLTWTTGKFTPFFFCIKLSTSYESPPFETPS